DLVTTNRGGNSVSVLLNNGDGTFAPRVDFGVGTEPSPIVSADFDGDGDQDLAVGLSSSANSIAVLLNLTIISPVGVNDREGLSSVPELYSLSQNYPNPFNPVTTIRFALPEAGNVLLVIYNLRGEEVVRLANGARPAGYHEVIWNATNFASGMYFYRLQAGEFTEIRKMILLK
ncbi:MAG: T9SS type A sorting domain-containing protein, partial [Candidatus Dadabacteria bacterium]|nr:T9SS type A sorting domain-containing protein [Candidatus Dadabacteria bacterium]